MAERLQTVQEGLKTAFTARQAEIEQKRAVMTRNHATARAAQKKLQQARWQAETKARQERFNKGLRGLLDRFTGYRRRIKAQNEAETEQARLRDREEQDALIFEQLEQRRQLQSRIQRLEAFSRDHQDRLEQDIGQYQEIQERKRDTATFERHASRRDSPGRER